MRLRWPPAARAGAMLPVAVTCIVALCAPELPAHAQQPTFSTRRESVRVDVLVSDGGQPVTGLKAGDFEILDSGVPQEVDSVSLEQLPLSLVLALDGSVSISSEMLENLRAGGRALLANLAADDQAALLTFADAVTLRRGLTTAGDGVRDALDAFEPSRDSLGGTALIDACYTALTVLDTDPGRGLVIVFTDGLDTTSWLPANRVLDAARRSNAVVYAVSTARLPRRSFLSDLAAATGGGAIAISSVRDVGAAFVRILEEFRQRYVVGFSPSGVGDGGWHPLTVRVKRRSAEVRARAGYTR